MQVERFLLSDPSHGLKLVFPFYLQRSLSCFIILLSTRMQTNTEITI